MTSGGKIVDRLMEIDFYQCELTKYLDCFQMPLYFTLKQAYNLKDEPYECFLQDTAFVVEIDLATNKLKDINPYSSWSHEELFDIQFHASKGNRLAGDFLRELENDRIVPFQTHSYRVPYFKNFISFDSEYDERLHYPRTDHIFMALACEDNKLFYLESPWLLHAGNFDSYQGSKQIGCIPLEKLGPAFECYLKYMSVSIDKPLHYERCSNGETIPSLLKLIGENGRMEPYIKDGTAYYPNNSGLTLLLELLSKDKELMQEEVQPYHCNVCKLLEWKFDMIKHRKVILLQSLLKHRGKYDGVDGVIAKLEEAIRAWINVITKLRNQILRNQYESGALLLRLLESVIDRERELGAELELYLAETARGSAVSP